MPETATLPDTQVNEDAAAAKTIPVAKPLDSTTSESVPWLAWAGGGALALISRPVAGVQTKAQRPLRW